MRVDFHMHSTVSDGTLSPVQLLNQVREEGYAYFSLTDHDDFLGCQMIENFLEPGDPVFIPGVELSAEEEGRKYHILGYGFDPHAAAMEAYSDKVRQIRITKVRARLDYLRETYGFVFEKEELDRLLRLPNPGKPHIGNLMIAHGYASSIREAIRDYINGYKSPLSDPAPAEVMKVILDSGGIPVLAHGIYGDGDQLLSAEELEWRVVYLKSMGLRGLESHYSRYDEEILRLNAGLCEKYDLLATAGSDYHGGNKRVCLGDTKLEQAEDDPRVMAFIAEAKALNR